MPEDMTFRRRAVATITNQIGVYVLCDLDQVPIYVGQSTDGIRARVRRHLTSARSDIIANRQIDVWEVAYVMQFPVEDRAQLSPLESTLFHAFDQQSALMNGTVPAFGGAHDASSPEPTAIIQTMADGEIRDRLDPEQRLPRQARHYANLVDHFLTVKNSPQIGRAMQAHFERLTRYHQQLLAT